MPVPEETTGPITNGVYLGVAGIEHFTPLQNNALPLVFDALITIFNVCPVLIVIGKMVSLATPATTSLNSTFPVYAATYQ